MPTIVTPATMTACVPPADRQDEQERDRRELRRDGRADGDARDGRSVPDDGPQRDRLESEHQRVGLAEADRVA